MIYIMTKDGWRPLGKPMQPAPSSWTAKDEERYRRAVNAHERLFFTKSGFDIRTHPKFGEGVHRYLDEAA